MTRERYQSIDRLVPSVELGEGSDSSVNDSLDALVTRGECDLERNRRTSRFAIVLLQVDRLAWNLSHVESPEYTRDGEPNLTLSDVHTRADTATSSEHPVVTLLWVGKCGTLGGGKRVVEITFGLIANVSIVTLFQWGCGGVSYVEFFGFWVTFWVVMHGICVQDNDGVLGNEFALVCEVLASSVGSSQPEGVANTFNLLDDSVAVRQVLLVFNAWEAVSSNDTVELFLCLLLNFWVGWDESTEPLHNSRGLIELC